MSAVNCSGSRGPTEHLESARQEGPGRIGQPRRPVHQSELRRQGGMLQSTTTRTGAVS